MGLACLSLPIFRWRSLGTNEARLACVLHGLLSGSIVAIWQRLCVFMYIRGCSREDVIFCNFCLLALKNVHKRNSNISFCSLFPDKMH